MPKSVAKLEVVEATLNGIKKARKEYIQWSGGESLYSAPEYFQTVAIAHEISKIDKNKFLTLEDNIDYVITESRVEEEKENKLPEEARGNGRADIVLWWAEGYARAVIEVKKWVYNINHIKEDLHRISKMLSYKKDNSKLQFGISTFYTSQYYERGDSKNTLIKHLENKLFKSVKKYAKDNGLTIKIYYDVSQENEHFSWAAVSLLITLKK